MHDATTRASLSAVLALAATVVLAGQQSDAPPPAPDDQRPPLTFRVEVNYVEVDVLVTDEQGNPVTDLTIDDFEVLEEGEPQELTTFSHVDIPVTRAERPLFADDAVEPDVQRNDAVDGRLYLIVLDELHTTFSNTPRVRAALRQFIERDFGANDLAAVVFTGGRTREAQDFTSNPRLLLAAVDRFTGRALPVAGSLGSFGGPCLSLPGVVDSCDMERGMNARTTLSAIRQLAEFLSNVRGRRKAMLFVSEGIGYNVLDVFNNRSASMIIDETREAIAAATRSNVSIYALDARGLATFDDGLFSASNSSETEAALGGGDPEASPAPSARLRLQAQLAQDSLRSLAQETGGFAAVNRNDFDSVFDRIVRDNSTYYVMGYYPSNLRRDGRFRRIDVRVRRPGVTVRARRGYVAPRGRAPETRAAAPGDNPVTVAAREMLDSPIAVSGLPLAVFAAPYKGTAPNAAIALAMEVGVDDFEFTPLNDRFDGQLEIAFVAVDSRGEVHAGDRHSVGLAFRETTLALARQNGFRVVSQIDLPPGAYQLRVAAAERGGQVGSVLYDLEVPDFYRAPLSMSGISLTSAVQSQQVPTGAPKNPLADFLPGPPTTAREFDRNDELALFVEFYENLSGTQPHAFDITAAILAEGGRAVMTSEEERSSTELQGTQGGYGFTARFPLQDLEPGLYVLRVEGRPRTAAGDDDNSVSREVQIRIRAS